MKVIALIIFATILATTTTAQQHAPEFLQEPKSWEYEQFPLPPSFAPIIAYKGFEELRFAPGMFKKDSTNYYTYIFLAVIDGTPLITEKDIQYYLLNYYRGLSASVAKDRKLSIDTSSINASVVGPDPFKSVRKLFLATVNTFGVFDDGAPVQLNLEITVAPKAATKNTFIFFLASPRAKDEAIWPTLRDLQVAAFKLIDKN